MIALLSERQTSGLSQLVHVYSPFAYSVQGFAAECVRDAPLKSIVFCGDVKQCRSLVCPDR